MISGFLSSVVDNLKKTIKQIDESLEALSKNLEEKSSAEIDEERKTFTESREKLVQFVSRIGSLRTVSEPFHFEIDDPSGNSFIENLKAPHRDEQMNTKQYRRNAEQRSMLGITEEDETDQFEEKIQSGTILPDEILVFKANCPHCNSLCDTNMKLTNIPHFKEVIIMATTCDTCGNKTNEVKSGTGIAPKGVRYSLKMTEPADLNRDILISETASFSIPDLDFELSSSRSIGGRFSTLEGIFTTIKTQLSSVIMPFAEGDSRREGSDKSQVNLFIRQIEAVLAGEEFVTVVLTDPAGSCYLQNIYAPDPDPNLTVEHYDRSEEEDELLGLNDMNVEDYDESG